MHPIVYPTNRAFSLQFEAKMLRRSHWRRIESNIDGSTSRTPGKHQEAHGGEENTGYEPNLVVSVILEWWRAVAELVRIPQPSTNHPSPPKHYSSPFPRRSSQLWKRFYVSFIIPFLAHRIWSRCEPRTPSCNALMNPHNIHSTNTLRALWLG